MSEKKFKESVDLKLDKFTLVDKEGSSHSINPKGMKVQELSSGNVLPDTTLAANQVVVERLLKYRENIKNFFYSEM